MTSSVVSSPLIVYPPRTPESFHGDAFEDVEDWLEHFERVADFNEWDEAQKLRNVYFALEESARTWYVNHEAALSSWQEFRRQLLATYASTDRREKAENALQARNQRTNESVGMYIQDMSRLFKSADPNMTENKKLRHLMRGVMEELFAGLVRNPPRSVAEFRTEATTIEKALQQRAHHYNRDVSSAPADLLSASPGSNTEELVELARSIVKEELRKLQSSQAMPTVSTLAAVICDEVRHAILQPGFEVPPVHLEQMPPVRRMPTYADVLCQPSVHNAPFAAPSSRQPTPRSEPLLAELRPRKSDVWRVPDRTPFCFHCGEAGHLYRMCPYRRAGLRGFTLNATCPRNGERPVEMQDYLSRQQDSAARYQHQPRSPASTRFRSPSPRPSSSSPGRRSLSPRQEN
ncbi:uncharacterized protein LOC125944129 [Dermacentor silvarum]|uniref:uncharacterized protein LOC125944129 n=1 Tax=Dermacentor silvarum TaxID=543639 RepID=UPI00210109A2|nr:uncharacterized protein LOC125944129 [Dermacentor silvarum]